LDIVKHNQIAWDNQSRRQQSRWDTQATPLNDYMPTSMATLAIKPESPVAAMKRKHKKDNQWT
jgi:hypothetical protein